MVPQLHMADIFPSVWTSVTSASRSEFDSSLSLCTKNSAISLGKGVDLVKIVMRRLGAAPFSGHELSPCLLSSPIFVDEGR